jgi:cyclase
MLNRACRPRRPGQKRLVGSALMLCLVLSATDEARAQPNEPAFGMLPVQGNVYMLHGPDDTNIAVQIGDDGVMLVNAMRAGLATQIVAEIEKLTPAPIRYIINTNPDLHLTGGNAELAAKGMFGSTPALAPGEQPGATLVAHENLMRRLSDATRERRNPFPESGVPRDTFYLPFKDIYFNGEPVFIIHEPNAHTDGDSIVLFRKSDTLAVGDIFVPDQYPVIDRELGGSVQGLIRALNHILDLAVPRRLQDGGTRVIPGRGRLCNEADVVEYRNMVVIVRDRVRDLIEKGLTLSEIREAGVTRDYDGEFGGSGDGFVESVYESLVAAR